MRVFKKDTKTRVIPRRKQYQSPKGAPVFSGDSNEVIKEYILTDNSKVNVNLLEENKQLKEDIERWKKLNYSEYKLKKMTILHIKEFEDHLTTLKENKELKEEVRILKIQMKHL